MRKLIALCALLLSASAALAQTEKAPVVTKLPGEEKLSIRERAERDFLMPVRRKKLAEAPKVTASADLESTAAPELDATAHYTEAPEARPEEVATIAHAEHHTALRHHSRAARLAALRHARAAEAHRSVRHSSKAAKAEKAKATKHHAKAEKASAHSSHKKEATHKTKTRVKKATASKRHESAKKKVSKTKTKTSKKHRR